MTKILVIDDVQTSWLLNGIEVELDAKRASLKQDMAPDERDMEERDVKDLEVLLKLVRDTKEMVVQCDPCTRKLPLNEFNKATMVYKKEEDPIIGGDIHTYTCPTCGHVVDMFEPVK